MLSQCCRHVGVGFQILNDLQDWDEHDANKKHRARDAETAKPTLLAALAAAAASPEQKQRLARIIDSATPPSLRVDRLRLLYELGCAFARMDVYYGFVEDPDVPELLETIAKDGFEFDMMETSFFVSRETLIASVAPGMARWRERLSFPLHGKRKAPGACAQGGRGGRRSGGASARAR